MKIKVCGMRDSQNIEALEKLSIDFIGLIFYEASSRSVMGNLQKEFLNSLPSPINRVGVFVNAEINKLIEIVKNYGLTYIQLHGNESTEYLREIKSKLDIKIIKAFNVVENKDFDTTKPYQGMADYFLFDTKTEQHGGSGRKFNWSILSSYQGETPFFLSGGISANDAEEIKRINHPGLFAVDINSRFEITPGLKDISQIEYFIKSIQS